MEKARINFQDQFLNIARRECLLTEVELLSGEKIRGHIKSFDNFCLLFESEGSGGDERNETGEQLIYKHALARITLLEAKEDSMREDILP